MADNKMTDFLVIGLGRFGKAISTRLYALGANVLAIDTRADVVNEMEDKVSTTVCADVTTDGVLHSLGARNFDCAIICIGDNLEGSILATQQCKELGINYIVAKAQNEQVGKILKSIGAHLVVYPEVYVAKKLASILTKPSVNEIMDLTDNYKLFEIKAPELWQNKAISELNVRKKYKLSIIFIKRANQIVDPEPETIILPDDIILIAGDKSKINAVSYLADDNFDIKNIINEMFDVNNE